MQEKWTPSESNEVIRVGVLEDQRLMRESLVEILSSEGFDVVASSGEPVGFLSRIHQEPPRVAIIDLTLESEDGLSISDGLSVVRDVRQWHPEVRTLVLSGNRSPGMIERCYEEGAAGYLYKLNATSASVVAAVKAVARGERLVPFQFVQGTEGGRSSSSEPKSSALHSLTAREREVLGYIAGGADNLKIATFLKISERTVKAHVSSLYRKLGPENRAQLALLARGMGVRPPSGL